jgi:hypothetical protein
MRCFILPRIGGLNVIRRQEWLPLGRFSLRAERRDLIGRIFATPLCLVVFVSLGQPGNLGPAWSEASKASDSRKHCSDDERQGQTAADHRSKQEPRDRASEEQGAPELTVG